MEDQDNNKEPEGKNEINDTSSWPEQGDRLFIADHDWWNNACMNKRRADWYPYIEGYRRAADLLAEHIISRSERGIDCLVYPIVFLYRQHLELRLKAIILEGNQLLDRECALPITYNILLLWSQCKSLVKEIWPEGNDEELEAVHSCMEEFHDIDKNSISFRYPVDKDENPSLANVPDLINVRHLPRSWEKWQICFMAFIPEYRNIWTVKARWNPTMITRMMVLIS
jgi:hypothetical protein